MMQAGVAAHYPTSMVMHGGHFEATAAWQSAKEEAHQRLLEHSAREAHRTNQLAHTHTEIYTMIVEIHQRKQWQKEGRTVLHDGWKG